MQLAPIGRIDLIIVELDFQVSHIAPVPFIAFSTNPVLTRAASYSVQTISEAVRHLPRQWTDEFDEVEWREIRSIGNVTRHEYASLRLRVIWEIATERSAELKVAMLEMKRRHTL